MNAAIGGTGTKTYDWTPGTPTGDGTLSVTGLTAGTWTCTATDANGCTAVQSFTLSQQPALAASTLQTNVSCNGGSNGTATVSVSGGTPSYSYSWSPSGGTGATASGLSAGAYTCTITDANGCTLTKSFTITHPSALTGSAVLTTVACFGGSNGAINLYPSGGTPGYTYNWGGGITTEDRIGLTAGTYSVLITDANGCTKTISATLTQPSAIAGSTVVTNAACFGGSNGAINLTPSGGTSPYTFNWGGGITTEDRTGLVAGSYSVIITDVNGCTGTVNVTVTQSSAIAGSTVVSNVTCNGGSNGAINLTPSGGTPGYTYNWGGGITTEDRTGLTAGTYSVVVTDANGCTKTVSATVTQPSALAASTSQTNVSCNGGSNGTATVVVSGGVSAYTYAWSPSGGTGATASGLSAGAYTCTITDANGCTLTRSFTITQPTALAASTSQVNVICIGGNNGSASVVASGGTAAYSYAWLPNGGTSATASNLTAGNYTCTITDANGCTLTKSFSIIQSDLVNPVAVAKNVTIFLNSAGNATITASEINDGSTYNCSIASVSASKTDFSCTDLGANNVTLTVTDASGNSSTAIAVVTLIDDLSPVADISDLSDVTGECSVTVIAPTATDNCAGVITATTVDPLTYDVQGSYIIHWTYSDGNGNSSTQDQNVIVKDVTAPVADIAILSDVTGECSASVIAPTATDKCVGVLTATTADPLSYNVQGSYLIHWTYSDGNGNSSTQDQNVIVKDVTAPVADIAILSDVTGECSASVIAPTATDACMGVINATTSDPLTYDAQGSYLIHWTYSDGNGNSSTQDQNVIVKDVTAPVADVTILTDVTAECSASVIAPTATDNCAGVITATTSDPLTYDTQGSYLIHWTYSDGNGNSSTQDQNVIVKDVTAPVADVAILTDVTGECSASVIAPTATDNCAGIITATTVDPLTYEAQGSYLIHWTYSDGNGNSSTQEQKVLVADVTAPVADAAILPDASGECSVSVIAPTATDNCAGVITATTIDPLTYDAQGSYIIHWTYTDGNGNSSTQEQKVIVADVTAPVADVAMLSDVTGECSASVIAPTATDNCAGVITATTSDPLTYDAQGSYIIHWTYSDGNGNSSTQEQKVIVADVTAPLITCTNDITVIAQESVGHYLIAGSAFDPESVTDNCGIKTLLNNVTNTSTLDGATLGVGSNVVTWTATDEAGNTSTCTTNITVQLNVGIPELNFKNVSVYPNPSKGMFTLEVPGSCTAVIYDVRGRIIQTEKMVDKLNKLDLTKCQQGVYLLKLIKDNQVVNMKLIVE